MMNVMLQAYFHGSVSFARRRDEVARYTTPGTSGSLVGRSGFRDAILLPQEPEGR